MATKSVKQPQGSLVNKLRLPIIASVVVILMVVGFALIQISRRALTQEILRVQRRTAGEVALSISSYLQGAQDRLVVLAQSQGWSELSRDEKKAALEQLEETQQGVYEELVFLDRAGNEVVKISRFYTYLPEELGSQAHNPAFQRAIAGERYVADKITTSPQTSLPVVEMAVPVRASDSENSVGVLLAQVSIERMWDLVSEVEVGETGYTYVINSTGHLLAHSELDRYLKRQGEKITRVSVVRKITSRFEEFTASQYKGLEGRQVVGAFAPIEETYWFAIVELPTSEAYVSLRRMMVFWLGLLVVTALAIGGLTSWLPQRIVRRPLERLEEGATLLSRGDLEHRIALRTGDELEALANTFNQMAEHLQELYAGLEQKVAERTRELERRAGQLGAAAEVARDAVSIRDPDQLLDETVHLISEQFGFYHAGVFLLDDAGEYAVLQAASSEGGRRMLARGHKLRVGEVGIVGYVSDSGEPRIALDVGEDAVFFDNPDLPRTRSEMAVPLEVRGDIIGVLDVQSAEAAAFDEEDVAILRTMADQVAVAIQNARLLEESQRAVRELRAAQGEYVRAAWERRGGTPAFEYDRVDVKPVDLGSTSIIDHALRAGETIAETRPDDGRSTLATPLRLRDQIIGALSLEETGEARPWMEDEIELVREVSEQVALALENARLFEEAQIHAEEMAVLNELGQSLSAQLDVEEVLDEAYQGTCRLLDASSFYVALYDQENERISFPLYVDEGERVQRESRTMKKGLTEYIIRNRESLLLKEDPMENAREMGIGVKGRPAASWLGVPLIVGGSVLGVMAVQSYTESSFYDEHDQDLLTAIASQTAIALQNAYLFEETEEEAQRRALINEVIQAASQALELEELLHRAGEVISRRLNMPSAFLAWDSQAREFQLVTTHDHTGEDVMLSEPSRPSRLAADMVPRLFHVVSARELQVFIDIHENTRGEMHRMIEQLDILDAAIIPLTVRDEVWGVLNLGRQRGHPPIDEGERDFLRIVAANLGVALENAQLYEEAVETAERLEEVDRLKNQFLANMSHELRTPLNSIIGFSRVILKGIDGPVTEQQKEDLEAIHGSGRHLLGLINDILDISKIEAGKMTLDFESVDLTEIVNGVMSTAVALVKDKPIELKQSVPDGLPTITADERRVRQVLLNLVSNAAKFTKEGFIQVAADYDSEKVTLSVTDTGPGIPEKKVEELFEPFTQVDASFTREHGGTGLGLTISRSFVDLHGGELGVDTELGKGSTFYFTLPIEGPPSEREREEEAAEEAQVFTPTEGTGKVVLCVDDDEGVIKLFRRYLSERGYQVVGLNEADRVLEEAKRLQPYAVTLDVMMPGRDGWQVIRDLKGDAETRRIPVIMCSIVSEKERGMSLGAADYLVKPIMEDELVAALERLDKEAGRHRVLVVDDQAEDRELLRRMIESQEGYEVTAASGGREAIRLVKQVQPHIIILDLMMPEVDGFAVLESVKADKVTRSIPIIVVTAKELTEEDHQRLNHRVETLVQKGVLKQDELLEDVASALRKLEVKS